jgi:hypothetical protein
VECGRFLQCHWGTGGLQVFYFRPAEVDHLLADPSKARRLLDWEPHVTFSELVNIMVHADLRELERTLKGGVPALSARFSTNGAKLYSMPPARVIASLEESCS